MDKYSKLKKSLQAVVGAEPNYPIRGVVKAISGQTCSVEIFTGLVVTNVRLMASINDDADYLLVTPAIGCNVVMISGNGSLDDLTVIKADKAAKIEARLGGLEVLLDAEDGKVSIKNSLANLKELMQEQADLLKMFKVYTPAGPSGAPLPDTIQAIQQWETNFNNLLK
jgi:hypothetical protein